MITILEQKRMREEQKAKELQSVYFVGSANVGKSCLFSAITRRFVMVSNYPGTTVEILKTEYSNKIWVDTPGIYGLMPGSEEEAVTVKMLLEKTGQTVILVLDARNLSRGIALFLALSELNHKFVIALNMSDEASDAGYDIDSDALQLILGVPVVPTVAVTFQGVPKLCSAVLKAAKPSFNIKESSNLEEVINKVEKNFADMPHSRIRARLALSGFDEELDEDKKKKIILERVKMENKFGKSAVMLFAQSRAELGQFIAECVTIKRGRNPKPLIRILGDASMHNLWGWPILAFVLYLIYQVVGVFAAGEVVDVIESKIFGEWLLPFFSKITALLPDGTVKTLLFNEEYAPGTGLLLGEFGLISMGITYAFAIILPVIFFFFLIFSIMEDTGYLPRLVVMLDRFFRRMGLNGRAVLPMVLGFGCDTMATMTTRILPSKKERILVTFLLALAVPCSAQMGVLAAMVASLSLRAVLVWFGVLLIVIFLTGWIGAKIIPGKPAPMIFEIPPLRIPKLSNITAKVLARTEWYLREAVPLFLIGTFALWMLDTFHLLGVIQRIMSPFVVTMLGLPPEAARAFLMGFLRRDYGAAGLYDIFQVNEETGTYGAGTEAQIIVSIVTITLFIPCIANFLVIAKERGMRTAVLIGVLTTVMALMFGSLTRIFLMMMGWW